MKAAFLETKLQSNVQGLINSCYRHATKLGNQLVLCVRRLKLINSILINKKLLTAVYPAVLPHDINSVVKGSGFSIIREFHCVHSVFWV